jgi:glutamate synthase (NADPH/NADH) large chain
MGLTEEAMRRRLAKGAKVAVKPLDARGVEDVRELLGAYIRVLRENKREEKAVRLERLLEDPVRHFRMVEPVSQQVDQGVSTE